MMKCTVHRKWMSQKRMFLALAVLFACALVRIDRIYFKRNHSFSVRFLYSCLPNNPSWDLPPPTPEQNRILDVVVQQKFHYLAKGCHTYAFLSEDGKYVLKFHRYASHMRKFPWLNHPFSYRFDPKRKKIREHNLAKLDANMQSYKESYLNLQTETGLILLHINRTHHLQRTVTIVDATGADYKISLDEVTFQLQHRADLIFETLDRLALEEKTEEAKKVISHIIQLIVHCSQKGYVNQDPVLRKNYGLLADRAIHIDVGDLVRNDTVSLKENYIPIVWEVTRRLRERLELKSPGLLQYYQQEIGSL